MKLSNVKILRISSASKFLILNHFDRYKIQRSNIIHDDNFCCITSYWGCKAENWGCNCTGRLKTQEWKTWHHRKCTGGKRRSGKGGTK